VTLMLMAVGFSAAALVIGRWWVPLLAAVTLIALAINVVATEGWEGADWGELGMYWDVVLAVLAVAGSVIGVGINLLARDLFRRSSNA
jgi:hypothetical protein